MALVNFKRGTKPSDVSSLDANTIYFFTDTKEIYLGSTPYGGDLTGLLTRLGQAETDIDGLETQLGELEEQLGELDGVNEDIASLQAWMASHKGEYTALEGKVEKKLDSITAADASVTIGGTDTAKTVKVAVSADKDNVLELKNDGLYVNVEGLPETALTDYTVTVAAKETANTGMAKTYEIKQGASGEETVVGTIDIPKDLVLSSGTVEVNADASHQGTWIKLVLNNDDVIWIAASDLVDTVSAGAQEGNPVQIVVTDGTKITATLTNGSVTKTHLATAVQTTLDNADAAYAALSWGTI